MKKGKGLKKNDGPSSSRKTAIVNNGYGKVLQITPMGKDELKREINQITRDAPIIENELLQIKSDLLLVWADTHLPYLNKEFTEFVFDLVEAWKIRHGILAGDFLNEDAFSSWSDSTPVSLTPELKAGRQFANIMDRYFETVWILLGNHDKRLLNIVNNKLTFGDAFRMITSNPKFVLSEYPLAYVNNSWLIEHPKVYNRVAGQVARQMVTLNRCNVACGHGHLTNYGFDVSGRDHAIDFGGLTDRRRTKYTHKSLTTHPYWVNSVLVLYKNYPYLIDSYCDKDFWIDIGKKIVVKGR